MKNINKIIHTPNVRYVNELLGVGWVFLSCCVKVYDDPEGEAVYKQANQYMFYSLGWPQELGDVVLPDSLENPQGICE